MIFTLKDTLPQETVSIIKAAHKPVSVFIIGGRNVISDEVEKNSEELVDGTVKNFRGQSFRTFS